jgi:hypothetical protein
MSSTPRFDDVVAAEKRALERLKKEAEAAAAADKVSDSTSTSSIPAQRGMFGPVAGTHTDEEFDAAMTMLTLHHSVVFSNEGTDSEATLDDPALNGSEVTVDDTRNNDSSAPQARRRILLNDYLAIKKAKKHAQ